VSTAVRRSVFTAFVIHLGVLPMNEFQRLLASLPTMRQQLGGEAVDKAFVSFLLLSKELVIEMDGVRCPGSVAAIINRFSSIHNELDQ
jgi:very-short-patch-repair endonuclease